jgi:hypothetical protein
LKSNTHENNKLKAMNNYNSNSKLASWALAGLAAGGALWYLLGTEKGKSLVNNLSSQARDISDRVKDQVADQWGNISNQVSDAASSLSNKASDLANNVKNRSNDYSDTAHNYGANL